MFLAHSERYKAYLKSDIRPDGRDIEESRQFKSSTNCLPHMHGSALVNLENTMVMASVQCEFDSHKAPFMIRTTVSKAPTKRMGSMDRAAQISKFLTDIFQGSIDHACYTISERENEKLAAAGALEKQFLNLIVDVVIAVEDGGVLDAAIKCLSLALASTIVPGLGFLPIRSLPVSSTFSIVQDKLIVDPRYSSGEEMPPPGRNSIATISEGGSGAFTKNIQGIAATTFSIVVDAYKPTCSELLHIVHEAKDKKARTLANTGNEPSIIHVFKPGGDGVSSVHLNKALSFAVERAKSASSDFAEALLEAKHTFMTSSAPGK